MFLCYELGYEMIDMHKNWKNGADLQINNSAKKIDPFSHLQWYRVYFYTD